MEKENNQCDFVLAFWNFSSAVFEMGNTKVIAAVYGPREVSPPTFFIIIIIFVL